MFKKTYDDYGTTTEDIDSPWNGLGKAELIEEALSRLPDWDKLKKRTYDLFHERKDAFATNADTRYQSNAWAIIDAYVDAAEELGVIILVDKNEQTSQDND